MHGHGHRHRKVVNPPVIDGSNDHIVVLGILVLDQSHLEEVLKGGRGVTIAVGVGVVVSYDHLCGWMLEVDLRGHDVITDQTWVKPCCDVFICQLYISVVLQA